VGGHYLFILGGELINKKKRKKYVMALDSHRSKYIHTTTNQKHAAAIDKGTKEGCRRRGAERKRDSIILGAIELGRDKN
jgi:hypothetical protein